MGLFKALQTFWGLVVLLGLGGYSLYDTITEPATVAEPDASDSIAFTVPTIVVPRSTPVGGYPTPAPLNIFLACDGPDGDSARYYVGSPGGFVVLRIDVDRELMLKVMAGEPTQLPAGANLVQTPCVRSRIRAGTFP